MRVVRTIFASCCRLLCEGDNGGGVEGLTLDVYLGIGALMLTHQRYFGENAAWRARDTKFVLVVVKMD